VPKTKKIYEYKDELDPCKWCDGTGINLKAFVGTPCLSCKGRKGTWKRIRFLVREEVIS
jgi:hypothetical protein